MELFDEQTNDGPLGYLHESPFIVVLEEERKKKREGSTTHPTVHRRFAILKDFDISRWSHHLSRYITFLEYLPRFSFVRSTLCDFSILYDDRSMRKVSRRSFTNWKVSRNTITYARRCRRNFLFDHRSSLLVRLVDDPRLEFKRIRGAASNSEISSFLFREVSIGIGRTIRRSISKLATMYEQLTMSVRVSKDRCTLPRGTRG